jgi:hypothetical protein
MRDQEFREHLKTQGLKETSVYTNMINIFKFFNFCEKNGISEKDINADVIKSYVDYLQENFANNTQLLAVQSLKKFLSFIGKGDLKKYAFISRDYVGNVINGGLTNAEFKRLLKFLPSLLEKTAFVRENARNSLAVKLLLACKNLKTGEILELKFGDFVLEKDTFIINANGKKAKIKAYFVEKEFEILLPYRDLLNDYIFVSKEKHLMGTTILRYNLLEIGKELKIDNLIPYTLRRTPFVD